MVARGEVRDMQGCVEKCRSRYEDQGEYRLKTFKVWRSGLKV